jgi:hypothetical protein
VSRDVVLAWLHAVHVFIYGEPFQEQQQEPLLECSAAGLAKLLTFADAVGSSVGVMKACLSHLDQLSFHVQAGEQQLQLDARAASYWYPEEPLQLYQATPGQGGVLVRTMASEEEKAQLTQQFTSQLEVLLHLAHKLQLPQLGDALHCCVRRQCRFKQSLLGHDAAFYDVLSERVLAAAAGCGQQACVAFINSIRTEP